MRRVVLILSLGALLLGLSTAARAGGNGRDFEAGFAAGVRAAQGDFDRLELDRFDFANVSRGRYVDDALFQLGGISVGRSRRNIPRAVVDRLTGQVFLVPRSALSSGGLPRRFVVRRNCSQ